MTLRAGLSEEMTLPPDSVDLLLTGGEADDELSRPCLVPLIVMDRKRLGVVEMSPKKELPDEVTLR